MIYPKLLNKSLVANHEVLVKNNLNELTYMFHGFYFMKSKKLEI